MKWAEIRNPFYCCMGDLSLEPVSQSVIWTLLLVRIVSWPKNLTVRITRTQAQSANCRLNLGKAVVTQNFSEIRLHDCHGVDFVILWLVQVVLQYWNMTPKVLSSTLFTKNTIWDITYLSHKSATVPEIFTKQKHATWEYNMDITILIVTLTWFLP